MNLIAKIFGIRSPLTVPAHTVYLLPGQPMPLGAALQIIAKSTDHEFVGRCMSHYSGYVREAAIGRAVELGGSGLLELITERVNDWVPEVRRAAANALLTLLATVAAEHFVRFIPRLRGLMLATRADHRSWLFEFERRLVESGGTEAIVAALTGADFMLRRAAFQVALAHQLLPVARTIALGLGSGDVVLALRALTLLDRIPLAHRARYITLAAESPFGPVRFAALKLMSSDPGSFDIEPFLWRTIFDSQGSLRSAAAKMLIERGGDVIGRCSTLLETGALAARQIRAGLSLLAEYRAAEVVPLLTRYGGDARSEIRAHALALQAKVSPSLADEIASRALLDPSRKVRKVAVRLCTGGAFVSLSLIRSMLVQVGDHHAALAVCARNKWDRLICIAFITELRTPAEARFEEMSVVFRTWLSDPTLSWTRPGAEQRAILSDPATGMRLAYLAEDRSQELRARLQEGGIEL